MITENEIIDARNTIEWVIEYLDAIGEDHKISYINGLEKIDEILEKQFNLLQWRNRL